jgi:hypothetical protein
VFADVTENGRRERERSREENKDSKSTHTLTVPFSVRRRAMIKIKKRSLKQKECLRGTGKSRKVQPQKRVRVHVSRK